MKILLFAILFFTSCTKDYSLIEEKENTIKVKNELYTGYKATIVRENQEGGYLIHVQVTATDYLAYVNVKKENVTIMYSNKQNPIFYTSQTNPNRHILELPFSFIINKFTN